MSVADSCSDIHSNSHPKRFWLLLFGGIALVASGCTTLIWPVASVVCLVVLILLLLGFVRPYLTLIITFLFITFQGSGLEYSYHEWSWMIPAYTLPILYGLVAWIAARMAGIIGPHEASSLDLPLLVLWVTGMFSLAWSQYWFDGVRVAILHTSSYALFLLISFNCRTTRQAEGLYWLWWGVGLCMVAIMIVSLFTGYSYSLHLGDDLKFTSILSQVTGRRHTIHGTMTVTKAVTFVMNHAVFCAISIMATRQQKGVFLFVWISIIAFLFVHLLTQARLELVGLGIGWVVFIYLMPDWWESRLQKTFYAVLTFAVALLLTIVVLYTLFNLTEFLARFTGKEATLPGIPFSAAQGRRHLISYGFGAIFETGGWGAGAGGLMRGVEPTLGGMMPSLYLTIMTDHGYGLLSLILLGWIISNLLLELRKALRERHDPRFSPFLYAITASLAAYGFAGLLDYNYYLYEVWLLLGFAVVTMRITHHPNRS